MYSRRAESRNVDVSNSPRPSAAVYLRWVRTWSFMHNLDVMRRINKEKKKKKKKDDDNKQQQKKQKNINKENEKKIRIRKKDK